VYVGCVHEGAVYEGIAYYVAVAVLWAVGGHVGVAGILVVVAFDFEAGTHARVHAGGGDVFVVVVEDVPGAETKQRQARIDVLEAVVVVGDFAVEIVGVGEAAEAGFPAVVQVVPGVGDVLAVGLGIEQAVVVVGAHALVHVVHLAVVDPDVVGGPFDADAVAVAR